MRGWIDDAKTLWKDLSAHLVYGLATATTFRISRVTTAGKMVDPLARSELVAAAAAHGDGEAYNRQLRDLIHMGLATPSWIVSHELPLSQAPEAYEHFDNRDDGWTKTGHVRLSSSSTGLSQAARAALSNSAHAGLSRAVSPRHFTPRAARSAHGVGS